MRAHLQDAGEDAAERRGSIERRGLAGGDGVWPAGAEGEAIAHSHARDEQMP
jgi:hypothetical protein